MYQIESFGAVADYEATMEVIGELQCALQQAGKSPGLLDGLWGKKTQKAFKALGEDAAMLGLDPVEVEAAIAYQTAHKAERPKAYMPEAAMVCAAPGVGAAGFLARNWKWFVGAGIATVGALGIGLYISKKREARPMGGTFLYNNPWLEATYGERRRGLGFTYNNPWLKQAGYAGRRGRGRGLGFTYNNPWLKQAGYAGRRRR